MYIVMLHQQFEILFNVNKNIFREIYINLFYDQVEVRGTKDKEVHLNSFEIENAYRVLVNYMAFRLRLNYMLLGINWWNCNYFL